MLFVNNSVTVSPVSPAMSTKHFVTLHILLLLLLLWVGVEGVLLPGEETEFTTKAGYKYSGTDDDQAIIFYCSIFKYLGKMVSHI